MKEETVSRIAMVILAVVMAAFGLFHIMKPSSLIGFVPSFLPGGKVWVYVVGVAFMLVALALLAHRQVKLAGYLL
ncbi:MAG TPA: hypothetical protein PKD90_13760, partial [Phnomibacter sp.]|nr:hypothetical protein [Phnomibacter sp.]